MSTEEQLRREDFAHRQQIATDKVLDKITTAEFWQQVGPDLQNKFKMAAYYLFASGVEFGVKELEKRMDASEI